MGIPVVCELEEGVGEGATSEFPVDILAAVLGERIGELNGGVLVTSRLKRRSMERFME